MDDTNINKISEFLPEAFYDVISYIIASSYFLFGILLTFDFFYSFAEHSIALFSLDLTWVFELFIVLSLMSVLYVIGIILTTFSYWLILIPTKRLFNLFNRFNLLTKGNNIDIAKFGTENLYIKAHYSKLLNTELTKRIAKLILIRNLVFSNLLLSIINLVNLQFHLLVISAIAFIITALVFFIRTYWLRNNYSFVKSNCSKRTDLNG